MSAAYWISGAESGKCATETPALCPLNGNGDPSPIDADLLGALEVCECTTSCTCSTSPAAAGVEATDFLLFVSSVESADCDGNTLAYAGTCQRDQYDRPTVGYANFCPSKLSTSAADWADQRATAVHELIHALGFNRDSWSLFRDEDGVTPRTPRDPDDFDLPYVGTMTCVDGSTQTARVPSNSTLEVAACTWAHVHMCTYAQMHMCTHAHMVHIHMCPWYISA